MNLTKIYEIREELYTVSVAKNVGNNYIEERQKACACEDQDI